MFKDLRTCVDTYALRERVGVRETGHGASALMFGGGTSAMAG
jgi:hypothetical protein